MSFKLQFGKKSKFHEILFQYINCKQITYYHLSIFIGHQIRNVCICLSIDYKFTL